MPFPYNFAYYFANFNYFVIIYTITYRRQPTIQTNNLYFYGNFILLVLEQA